VLAAGGSFWFCIAIVSAERGSASSRIQVLKVEDAAWATSEMVTVS
jgi:hypothetical protein